MLTATKVFQFDCAHMLSGHLGLCQNLHGHTYKLEVEAISAEPTAVISEGPSAGMVEDFSDLKAIVKEHIVDVFDHAFIFNQGSPDMCEVQIADTLRAYGKKVVNFPVRPTAEQMAIAFLNTLAVETQRKTYQVVRVRVWETPTSYAEVII